MFHDITNSQISLLANSLRSLSIDMVQKANSGHPGTPLGIADVLAVLFTKFVKFSPNNPKWLNRDRFILSAGHASAVLYSLFYLLGYEDITLEDLKNFRQLHSKTAGHPEYGFLKAIEVTTGPLGQGIANGVGMAIAEEILKTRYEEEINHKTFVLAGDGCFMEGVACEAMALAGHLGLSNLIYVYDKNNITIDGKLSLAESTDFKKRFEALNFNVLESDGHNYDEIESAFNQAISFNNNKPTIIIFTTHIGFGSPNKVDSEQSHGAPLGESEISLVKKSLNVKDEPFYVEEEVLQLWRNISLHKSKEEEEWTKKSKIDFKLFCEDEIKKEIQKIKQNFFINREEKATRQHSSFVLNNLSGVFTNLIGGSADLSESNGAKTKSSTAISKTNFAGNYIHYGIREHAMGAIMNGISLHSIFKTYGSTFLVFADYMRPAIRLAALMKIPTIYILTHDSVSLGEDGPTHQPVEHLTSLRIIPNLMVFRPADGIETIESLECAMLSKSTPSVIALSRQKVSECTHTRAENLVQKGAYFVLKNKGSQITLFGTGSELSLCFEVSKILEESGIISSIVSIPCLELFEMQDKEYKNSILNCEKRIFIEAGILGLLSKYKRDQDLFFGVETFGESGKPKDVLNHFGLTANQIATKIINHK